MATEGTEDTETLSHFPPSVSSVPSVAICLRIRLRLPSAGCHCWLVQQCFGFLRPCSMNRQSTVIPSRSGPSGNAIDTMRAPQRATGESSYGGRATEVSEDTETLSPFHPSVASVTSVAICLRIRLRLPSVGPRIALSVFVASARVFVSDLARPRFAARRASRFSRNSPSRMQSVRLSPFFKVIVHFAGAADCDRRAMLFAALPP